VCLILLINLLFKEVFSPKIHRKKVINMLRQKVIDLEFNCNFLLSIFNGKSDDPITQCRRKFRTRYLDLNIKMLRCIIHRSLISILLLVKKV